MFLVILGKISDVDENSRTKNKELIRMVSNLSEEAILVIGGGVSGIQASLDLAEMGYRVYLVERSPSIGGVMAQLDKTFPTNDCSICILAPKMVEVARHQNIELFTYSEVKSVKKIENGFKVLIYSYPRYVDADKCTGCRQCQETCPIEIPNEYEMGLKKRKAIYILFPQAVPNIATIDNVNCIECGACEKRCKAKAIDYWQEIEEYEFDVKAIIIATGFDLINTTEITRLGHGKYPNVLTSLEYERMMSASGPTRGHVLRLSDGKKPKSLTFIQCVGSRNQNYAKYCSKVCCMYSTKESIITKEHYPEMDVQILYNDIRAMGKGFFEFIQRAKNEYGIKYVKGVPGEIEEDPETNDLIIYHEDIETGEIIERKSELVILAPAMIPKSYASDLLKILNISSNDYGFVKTLSPLETELDGIYVVGTASGPKDIPESVAEASGGAAKAALKIKEKQEFNEKLVEIIEDVEQPRIGVFVCWCGSNIGAVVDIKQVAEYVKTLPNVVYVTDNLYTCSGDTQTIIKEKIKEHKLNRIIVSSCTPSTHEELFRKTCAEAGLNPYLFDLANIREQCSWVHMNEPEKATEKAKDIIRMYVNRVNYSKPQNKLTINVTPSCAIIGGGISGMTAAQIIADKGFEVHVIEKTEKLGGFLNNIHKIHPLYKTPKEYFSPLFEKLNKNKLIKTHFSSELIEINGSIGNFELKLKENSNSLVINVGTIIIATGSQVSKPIGLFNYGNNDKIHNLEELESLLKENSIKEPERIGFILCANSRLKDGITYCSSICCTISLKNALEIKKRFPKSEISIFYRDINVYGKDEEFYRKLRENCNFISYNDINDIKLIKKDDNSFIFELKKANPEDNLKLELDRIILATAILPNDDNINLNKLFKIPLAYNGFFLEAHVKHRPLDFAADGIYLCGSCQSPKNLDESIAQACGAASRALIPLIRGKVEGEAIIAEINADLCVACEICTLHCPYGAPSIITDEDGNLKSKINQVLCKGCGVCAAGCPVNAITMKHFTDDQIKSMINSAYEETSQEEPKIITFLCNWCSYAGADNAGVSRFQYPTSIRPIRVMCSGRISILHILEAFRAGADGVLITGCHIGDCHYISGNFHTQRRVKTAKKILEKVGINPERLGLEWISASEGNKYANLIKDFVNKIKELKKNQEMVLKIAK
ncbi:MAG: hydrogenase iron-sulfur subunit [Candidatus Lokiarchaeota archaeon]|nr:hydrogenase iron-sulfur subunit [Candidatus Lokiarchaeota archaeon]